LSLYGILYRIVLIPRFYYLEVRWGCYRKILDTSDYLQKC
jgi:hypothetical protein